MNAYLAFVILVVVNAVLFFSAVRLAIRFGLLPAEWLRTGVASKSLDPEEVEGRLLEGRLLDLMRATLLDSPPQLAVNSSLNVCWDDPREPELLMIGLVAATGNVGTTHVFERNAA